MAACSGVRARRRPLSSARPSGGTAYRPKAKATSGCGRARMPDGSAGSTSTRPATVSGCRAACMAAIRPPIELPTRIAGGPATSVRKRCSSCWLASTEVGSPPPWVRPNPGQVQGEHPAGGGEQRSQGGPVDQRAAQPVHADEQRAVGRAAVVDVVHPAAEVGPPGLRPREPVRRARVPSDVGGSAGVPCAWLMRRH